jgi:hypothetical protein
MAGSKLEAMAIYVVKQACGNGIMASVYPDSNVCYCGLNCKVADAKIQNT